MNAKTKCLVRTFPSTMLLITVCFIGLCGCVHKPSAADYKRIEDDRHLTGDQKTERMDALTPTPDALYQQDSLIILFVGAGLLAAAYFVKTKLEGGEGINLSLPTGPGWTSSHYRDEAEPKKPQQKTGRAFNPEKAAVEAERMSKYFDRDAEPEPTVKRLPETRAEVDAIPYDQRSMSFFTSRPLPISELRKVTVRIGYRQTIIMATQEELEMCKKGDVPRIRAFSIKGKVIPWFDWNKYDSYKHYLAMVESGWSGTHDVIPCWIKLENCDPTLQGYKDRIEKLVI